MRTREPEIWKGIVAGAAAGLVATWAMTQFQTAWNKLKQKRRQPEDEESRNDQGQAEDATMKTAGALARTLIGRDLTIEEKKRFGPLVHYGFGTAMGALYGGMREKFEVTSLGWGTAFGSALFLGADEIAVPLFGLGPKPTDSPLNLHLYAWASHVLYGALLESVHRPVRAALGHETIGSRMRTVAEGVRDDLQEYAEEGRRRARPVVKSTMKRVEKAARKIRKAA